MNISAVGGVGDLYTRCNDYEFGSGNADGHIGDKWLGEIQVANKILTVPGANIAFDKDQPDYASDNGMWLGWGWTYLNLNHPRAYPTNSTNLKDRYKYWVTFIESYDYQGPVNGYMPEYWNKVDPKAIKDGSYQKSVSSHKQFGTFSTLGSSANDGVANEQWGKGTKVTDNTYYLPVPRMPSYKDREYIVANAQNIDQSTMDAYSTSLRNGPFFNTLIPTNFLKFVGIYSTTHSQLRINETINGVKNTTMVRPPYTVGYNTYSGFIQWPTNDPVIAQARNDLNGYLYYKKLNERYQPIDPGSEFDGDPNVYKSQLVAPPDDVKRVPLVESPKYHSYKERDTTHPDYKNWDVTGKTRYTAKLQNGSTATYVWFKFRDQPAVKTAQQNWPNVYTDAYLDQLQTYIENLHKSIASRSSKGPSNPVFINYKNPKDPNNFNPHLVKLDPGQVVTPPAGMEVGYVPLVISVYFPLQFSDNGAGKDTAPDPECSNSTWTNTYFPNP